MPIRSRTQLRLASQLVDELSDRLDSLTAGERAYFDVLCDLIKHYEDTIYKPPRYLVGAEALKFLLEQNHLTQADLARERGMPRLHLSAFLAGTKELSKGNALKLAERFRVSPALFLV